MKRLLFTCLILLQVSSALFSQVITKTTPPPTNADGTVCASFGTNYEVSVPTGFESCTITWTATNGTVTKDPTDQRKATAWWTDTPNTKGKITATFSNCTKNSDANGKTASLEELILSVKNQSWGTYNNSIPITYCNKNQVVVMVPAMVVQGTGGINQPTRVEASYDWTIPAGWRQVATGRTGSVATNVNSLYIEPIECSKFGSVTVRGNLYSVGCGSSTASAQATVVLVSTTPVATVVPQAGYSGGVACNTAPVTFYANTSVTCISGYQWSFPPSWTKVSESGNSITLRPSGSQADSNPIKATIALTCGTSLTSPNFVPIFTSPEIILNSSATAICSGGTTVTLNNAGQNPQVSWATSSNMFVYLGQGTIFPTLKATTATTRGVGKITATITNCPSATIQPKQVWVGKPYDFLVTGPTQVAAGTTNTYFTQAWNGQPTFSEQGVLSTGYSWSFPWAATNAGWDCYSCTGPSTTVMAGSQSTIIAAQVQNTCGATSRNYEVFVQQENCPPGGCEEPFFVYPNPSSDVITIATRPDSKSVLTDVKLLDANGNTVFAASPSKTNKQVAVSVKDLRNGVYHLRLSYDGKVEQHQVVINH